MRQYSVLNKALLAIVISFISFSAKAQQTYPVKEGDKVRYNMQIDIRDAYLSGICILSQQGNTVVSSIVNEFGVSMMDFTYNPAKDKVKIRNIIKKLNRWYIKLVLKRDIKAMLQVMRDGGNEYYDEKYKIRYTFSLNNDFEEQSIHDTE